MIPPIRSPRPTSSGTRRSGTPSRTGRRFAPRILAVAAAVLLAATVAPQTTPQAAAQTGSTGSVADPRAVTSLPQGPFPTNFSILDALGNAIRNPDTPPPGADDPNCRPSPEHPRPVVLVHGTFENRTFNWWSLSPVLRNAGYCVFTLNYGQEVDAWRIGVPGAFKVGGTGPVMDSARQLADFVEDVRARTGAEKVDIIGHSQGGMMPRLYLKYLGGADKVENMIGLAPGTRGTTFWGLLTTPPIRDALAAGLGPAVADQSPGSRLLTELNADGGVPVGPRYTVIASRYDWVATPWEASLLPGDDTDPATRPDIRNIVLQDSCGTNATEHLGMPFNPATIAYVLNALDPSYVVDTPCVVSVPILGG